MFGQGKINEAYPNFDISTLVTSDCNCEPYSFTVLGTTGATWSGTLPNIVVTPTADSWTIEYEACCDNGTTCDTGLLTGTACSPSITGGTENFDVLFGSGTTGVAYTAFDMATLVTSECDCEPYTYTFVNATGVSFTVTGSVITITPALASWSIEFEVCCDDGTTCDSVIMLGTACVPSITAADEDFDAV